MKDVLTVPARRTEHTERAYKVQCMAGWNECRWGSREQMISGWSLVGRWKASLVRWVEGLRGQVNAGIVNSTIAQMRNHIHDRLSLLDTKDKCHTEIIGLGAKASSNMSIQRNAIRFVDHSSYFI